jgi:hypothetical protein
VQTLLQSHPTGDGAGAKLVRIVDPRQARQRVRGSAELRLGDLTDQRTTSHVGVVLAGPPRWQA